MVSLPSFLLLALLTTARCTFGERRQLAVRVGRRFDDWRLRNSQQTCLSFLDNSVVSSPRSYVGRGGASTAIKTMTARQMETLK